MENKKIFVVKPFLPPVETYIDYVKKIWNNEYLTNNGPLHNEFQETIQKQLKINNSTLFTNGHLALECALKSLDLRPGGEIITTPFTFISTTHAIVNNGFVPVFCDIKLTDYTIDEEKIEKLITDKTVAIMPVHVYGYPCNVEKIEEIAKKYNLKVIYDSAHAFGVEYKNNSILNYGDISMLSFHATKLFHSIEGGMLAYNDNNLISKLDFIKNFGIIGNDIVDIQGINAKMNEFQAAMGLSVLPFVNQIIEKRKHIVNLYRDLLNVNGIYFVEEKKDVKYNYAYFPILVDETKYGLNRDELCETLKNYNIFSRKYFYPLTSDANCYKNKYKNDGLENAKYVSNRILTLPLYPDLTDEEVRKISKIIINKGNLNE